MLKGEVRSAIRQVFDYAIESKAKPDSVMRVVEAAAISERDLISGVDAEVVRFNFVRMLCEGVSNL